MKMITILHEVLSDAVSPAEWVKDGQFIKDANGQPVCMLTGTRQEGNGKLILLSRQLAQFALDSYSLLGMAWNKEPKNTAIREAFVACGELIIALEPLVVSVSGFEDE